MQSCRAETLVYTSQRHQLAAHRGPRLNRISTTCALHMHIFWRSILIRATIAYMYRYMYMHREPTCLCPTGASPVMLLV